jgi:hypothetical protein
MVSPKHIIPNKTHFQSAKKKKNLLYPCINPAPSNARDWIYEYMATIIWMSYLMNHKPEKRRKKDALIPAATGPSRVGGSPASLPHQ